VGFLNIVHCPLFKVHDPPIVDALKLVDIPTSDDINHYLSFGGVSCVEFVDCTDLSISALKQTVKVLQREWDELATITMRGCNPKLSANDVEWFSAMLNSFLVYVP